VDAYRPIVLSEERIVDERIFRVMGMCGTIVVREDIKQAIEGAGFVGQRFDEVAVSR
jgi:hypothetical protein